MIIPILITILATTILTNGVHARPTMEPPMSASNEHNVDGAIAKADNMSGLGKYLDKVINELEDMDNWVKDESLDIMTIQVSKFLKVD